VLLDLRLGSEDGLDLLREIRSRSDVPVIITTGHRRDEIDRVVGLELGADDYVTKPFAVRELLTRSARCCVDRNWDASRCNVMSSMVVAGSAAGNWIGVHDA
jgi:DNA-binding response OmpR family regulator